MICVALKSQGFVILQISRLTWYTRFDPVKTTDEVAITDLYSIESDTQYTKEMETDVHKTKDGTFSCDFV